MLVAEFHKQREALGNPEAVVISPLDVEELMEEGKDFVILSSERPREGKWTGVSIGECRLIEILGLSKGTPLRAWAE